MVQRKRKYQKGDNPLRNINCNIDKNLKLSVTKKILELDEVAINQISKRFLQEKAVQEYKNEILQKHRSDLRAQLHNAHEKVYALEKQFGITKRFKKRRRSYKPSGMRKITIPS